MIAILGIPANIVITTNIIVTVKKKTDINVVTFANVLIIGCLEAS